MDRLDGFTHYTTRMLRNSATPVSLTIYLSIYLSIYLFERTLRRHLIIAPLGPVFPELSTELRQQLVPFL